MGYQSLNGAITLLVLAMPVGGALAFDDSKYPNFRGRWDRFVVPGLGGQPSFDQTKPWGFGQQAPLTPEYRAVLEASLADQAKGGQGNFTGHDCRAYGMPLMMIAFYPQEYVITPDTTYILVNNADHGRRVFTDGRDFPNEIEPTFQGYSIGKWTDEDGDGVYDVLEVETRGPFKGPRVYDATGLRLHFDTQSVFRERISRDKDDPKILHDVITTIDHALTRPWTVDKKYVHSPNPRPRWGEANCAESMNNSMIAIGRESYYMSGDGMLMPVRKN